jgi:hypothetical protein
MQTPLKWFFDSRTLHLINFNQYKVTDTCKSSNKHNSRYCMLLSTRHTHGNVTLTNTTLPHLHATGNQRRQRLNWGKGWIERKCRTVGDTIDATEHISIVHLAFSVGFQETQSYVHLFSVAVSLLPDFKLMNIKLLSKYENKAVLVLN